MKIIDEKVIMEDETVENHELDIQKQLLKQRRARITVMSLLLMALVLTIIFGTIEDPFQYTFSKIGNRFDKRVFYIVWALFTGFSIQTSTIALFRLENFNMSKASKFIIASTVFLVISAITPSLEELYPLWYLIHVFTAALFGLFFTLSIAPFLVFISRENPRLRIVIKVWTVIIWVGSFFWMFLLGNTGIFELWFFLSALIFLLYLSLTLFEEQIIKQSAHLLRNEEDLDKGIERIFVDTKKNKNKKSKAKKKS